MPFLCVATSQAARNQVRRPRWLPWSTVPAVTETCRAQAAHCRVNRSRPSSQPLSCPQAGQRKPSGQRFSSSQRAQAASSGNLASNSGSDRGSSVIHPPPVCSGTTYSPTGARGMSHSIEYCCENGRPAPQGSRGFREEDPVVAEGGEPADQLGRRALPRHPVEEVLAQLPERAAGPQHVERGDEQLVGDGHERPHHLPAARPQPVVLVPVVAPL